MFLFWGQLSCVPPEEKNNEPSYFFQGEELYFYFFISSNRMRFIFSEGDPSNPLSIRIVFSLGGDLPPQTLLSIPTFWIFNVGETLFSEQVFSWIYDTSMNILFLCIKMTRLLVTMFVNRLDHYVNALNSNQINLRALYLEY